MEGQPPTPCWSNILKKPPQAPPSDHQATPASGYIVPVTSCKSTKGLVVAVVDANAIIEGGQSLAYSADRFVSVSEVITEIRDPVSRHSLKFLPFSVDILEPASDALKKVINFARATGDLQSLSDVDLKLIALTYMLEAQIHGTQHLRPSPPPIHSVNVKRLPEKDMPGWGSNVPNLEEWEALEHVADDGTNSTSKILPLKDLNLNVIPSDQHGGGDDMTGSGAGSYTAGQVDVIGKPRKFAPVKREVKIEGKMVADGVDATQGQFVEDAGDWQPAVSRSTRRRFLRRKSRRELSEASSEKDGQNDISEKGGDEKDDQNDLLEEGEDEKDDDIQCPDLLHAEIMEEVPSSESNIIMEVNDNCDKISSILHQSPDLLPAEFLEEVPSGESNIKEVNDSCDEISSILHDMRLEEESLKALQEDGEKHIPTGCLNSSDLKETSDSCGNDEIGFDEEKEVKSCDEAPEKFDLASEISESIGTPNMDDNSSEQSWTVRSLSESSVACITSDYAMQNVLLQIGLRLVAPGGRQIRELHRWVLKCHACFKVTMEIGRIFCPSCGNGGTLRKVAVTVSENGIILAARKPRISIRGTKFSLPLPQGGRDGVTKNPVLREDQIPSKYLRGKPKKKNKQDEDVFLADNIFLHHTDKKAPMQPPMRKALAVFSGRRNPNDNHFGRAKH